LTFIDDSPFLFNERRAVTDTLGPCLGVPFPSVNLLGFSVAEQEKRRPESIPVNMKPVIDFELTIIALIYNKYQTVIVLFVDGFYNHLKPFVIFTCIY